MNSLAPIAIVGIAVEIPSGHCAESNLNHDTFFDFLLEKKEAYQEFPSTRFDPSSYCGPNLGQTITSTGSFLKDISLFDPTEFGITAKDAKAMAVGTRKLIETTFLALLDSGIDYRGRNVGCYMSAVSFDALTIGSADVYEPRGSFAGYPFLDFIQYSQGSILAPDGKCKPFDISANGFSRGEGVGVIVLKPLKDAIRDGDHIYASILGTGINSTGSAGPVSAPVAEAQIDAMRRACMPPVVEAQNFSNQAYSYTGTAAGDPIEANWVGSAFKRPDELLVGSVKGNIGHLEIMSFLASLSKVCSMFRWGIIPPTANLHIPNPAIRWDEHRMRAPTESTPLSPRHPSGRALISISSSGIGGSNGHAVLEGPPVLPVSDCVNIPVGFPLLFVAAGLSPRSAADIGIELVDLISQYDPHNLAAVSGVYGRRSRQMSWRSATVYVPNQGPATFPSPRFTPRKKQPLVFVFSSQEPQHFQMGRQLFKYFAPFRQSIERMDQMYLEATGTSLIQRTGLFDDNPSVQGLPERWPIAITLPALAMLQMALCDLFAEMGIIPDAVVGHSAGETPALTHPEQLHKTQRCVWQLPEAARSQDLINSVLKECPDGILEIACYNARDSVTLAGITSLIEQVVDLATDRGFFARKLHTDVPVHSSLMESCRQQYETAMSAIFDGNHGHCRPQIRAYSSLTGRVWTEPFSAEYFWSNTRMPVRFSEAIGSLLSDAPNASFMEIGPHSVLGTYIESFDASLSVIAPMKRSKFAEEFNEIRTFLSAVGNLIVDGCNVSNFAVLIPQVAGGSKISTPPYPFARKAISYRPDPLGEAVDQTKTRLGPLNGPSIGLNSLTHPILAQHVIRNEPIMPAAGYLGMAFEFGARYLWNVQFDNIMPLFPDRVLRVQVLREGNFWSVRSWTSVANPAASASAMQPSCLEFWSDIAIPRRNLIDLKLDDIRDRCTKLDIRGFYERMSYFAQFGKAYQRVTGCHVSDSEGLIRVRSSEEDLADAGHYHLHPVVLDSCIHALVHPAFTRSPDTSIYYLPSSVQTVTLHQSFNKKNLPSTLYSYAKLLKWDPEFMVWDVSITDAHSALICTLGGLCVSRYRINPHRRLEKFFKLVYQVKGNQERDKMLMHCRPQNELKPLRNGISSGTSHSVFRQILNTIIQVDREQVVRILILSFERPDVGDDYLNQNDVPESTLLDYTFGTVTAEQTMPLPKHVRKIQFHPDSRLEGQGMSLSTFDIIIALDIPSPCPHDLSKFMENMSRLLQPGGYFVVGPVLGEGGRRHSEIERQDGVEHFESSWQRKALQANFSRVELHPDGHADGGPNSFVLEAQKPSWPALPWHSSAADTPFFVEFSLDQILQYQQIIRECDDNKKPSFWIIATSGKDDAVALGFSRSLRREMQFTKIFLVLFDPTWLPKTRLSIIGDLATNPDVEVETLIDKSGYACVPRLVHCTSQSGVPDFDLDRYWQISSGVILAEAAPAVPDGHVLVRVTHLSSVIGGLQGFAGRIENSRSVLWSREDVVGVVNSDRISNHFLVHEGQIVAAADDTSRYSHAAVAVPLTILATALGAESVRTPVRLCGRKFLVTNADEPVGRWLTAILSGLGAIPETFTAEPTEIPLETIRRSHFIFSGYSSPEDIQVIQSSMNPDALAVWWNGSTVAPEIRRNPWIVADALGALKLVDMQPPGGFELTSRSPEEHLAQHPRPHVRMSLFNSQKSYLLIGGIGSLGLGIAWWMYRVGILLPLNRGSNNAVDQMGARHIILTSRSGEISLTRDKNTPAIRLLTYLRSIPDLDLRLEACDAASCMATTALVKSASPPLAGCMLMAVVFSDRAYVSHTEESFYIPFEGKERAFLALEQALAIRSLDFLITVSSVTGLFGSPGQTNYAGANTSVNALTQAYPNAFSIVSPAILESNFHTDFKNLSSDPRFKMWTSWGITSQQLFECIEEGILALNSGASPGIYLPDVDWQTLRNRLGDSPMYDHLLKGPEADRETLPEMSESSLRDSVRRIVVKVLDLDDNEFSPDIPFTSYGLDSLSAGRLSFALRPMVEVTQLQLLADVSLTDVLRKFLRQDSAQAERTEVPEPEHIATHTLMDDLVGKFTDNLGDLAMDPISPLAYQATARHTVLLTGSTGALGCHLLAHLLEKDNIQHVYALNRRNPDGLTIVDRQTAALQNQGLPTHLACSEKLTLIVGDLGDVDFGISFELMDKLRSSATHIIHNAWRIDLVARLSEFEDLILGTHRLLEFAIRSSPIRPSLSFISTLGIFRNLDQSIVFAPESPIEDAKIAAQVGYTESKWVAERMVQIAVERRQLNANVIRVGQLTGSDSGSWDTAQWIPALVQSGIYIGCLPDGVDTVSWIPIGAAAAAILDMQNSMNDTFHLIHPRPTTWRQVMEPLASAPDVPLVPYAEWFARLENTADFVPQVPGADAKHPAALKLLDFFQRGLKPQVNWESVGLLPRLALQKGTHASETLRNVPPLGPGDIESWVRYWRQVGFLPDQ
ncbi:hypothetical protein C8R45DRAFT_1175371 [Mycena sanguinolenta]|nr:hypothetical protein C8R45DRAFT_1175371 [Mycena sanguinolenta]